MFIARSLFLFWTKKRDLPHDKYITAIIFTTPHSLYIQHQSCENTQTRPTTALLLQRYQHNCGNEHTIDDPDLWSTCVQSGKGDHRFTPGWSLRQPGCLSKIVSMALAISPQFKANRASSNWDHIPLDQKWRYRLLCKLLLKQGKVSVQSQKNALQIIGTTTDLRLYFVKYGMIEELADLYLAEDKPADCIDLLLENGLLDRALEVFLNQSVRMNVPEKTVLKILDYVWAGRYFIQSTTLIEKASPDILESWKSDAVTSRNNQWKLLSCIKSYPSGCRRHDPLLSDIEDPTIRYFRGLLEIINIHKITSLTHFDELPLKMIGESVIILLKCLWRDDVHGFKAMLLLAGVWPRGGSTSQYSLLAWSALHEQARSPWRINNGALVKVWIRSKTATALLTLHAVAKDLWKTKWPKHCLTHLSQGSCSQIASDQSCTSHHGSGTINRAGCRLFIKDLLRLTQIFCNLAPLYYTRTMPKDFQQQYLGIRRYWLERLLRALTYISSIDQDASTILHFQTRLFHEKRSLVTSALEELLYFRLRQGWTGQANLSWILAQFQFAQTNTWSFQGQHSRAILSQLASSGHQGSLKNIISKLYLLQDDAGGLRHRDFRNKFRTFLLGFDEFLIEEYSHMHAVTAILESLAVYLILMTCPMGYVVPRSWVSLYMPSVIGHVERAEFLGALDIEILRECLVDLVNGFTRLLWRADQGFQNGSFAFSYGGKVYPKVALQQRNVELLAIALINAADYQPQPPGFLDAWKSFQKVCPMHSLIDQFISNSQTRCLHTRL